MGFDINHKNNDNEDVFCYACVENNSEVIDFLINLKVKFAKPLHDICRQKNANIDHVLSLLNNVEEINEKDSDNKTALYYAYKNKRFDIVNILLKYGGEATFFEEKII